MLLLLLLISCVTAGGLEQQRDFNLSDSASYPRTVEDGYLQGDDSTAQSDQPVPMFAPAALWSGDSASAFTAESPLQRLHCVSEHPSYHI